MKESLPLTPYEIDPVIRMETDLQSDLSRVEVDSTQMKMVLSALVAHVVETMEGPGRIRIIARNEKGEEEFAKHYPGLKPGFYAFLTIEDDGIGIDEKKRTRVFEPFFTTKFQGRGIGPAAVYGIVKNHDGWIGVDSKLGAGTMVHIYLPTT
ncbi:MAG: ATP-binding protein [Desulfatiglandales bacterium]|nr:ATP-binding protein [Desulfatiglandales bacterium]